MSMKNSLKYIFPLIVVCTVLTTGCRDYAYDYLEFNPDEVPEMTEPGLKISSETLMISATADPEAITVSALGGDWTIEKDPTTDGSWITSLSATSGKDGNTVIGIQAERNNGMTERFTKLLIKQPATNTIKEITVGQFTFESEFNRYTDSLALVSIFKSYNGDNEDYGWATPWDLRKSITEWHSITVEEVNGEMRVVGFKIQDWGNWFGPLHKDIGNLRELRTLVVPSQSNSDIPSTIANLRKVEIFNIESKGCTIYFPEGIGNMISLKTINTGQASVEGTSLGNLYNLTSLESITLSDPKTVGEMPDGISKMAKLKTIRFSGIGISRLPNDIGDMASLESLDLSNCKSLLSVPASICNSTTLLTLKIGGMPITSLPENIGDIQSLTSINISSCEKLITLPNSFARLKIAGELNLSNCKALSKLPNNLGDMVNITKLNLNNCEALTELPASLGNYIKEISLSSSKSLTTLSSGIAEMQNLEKLSVSSCSNLTSLPSNFGSCPKLLDLTLSNNALTSLPSTFNQLVSLTKISMSGGEKDNISANAGAIFGALINLKEITTNNHSFSGDLSWLKNLTKLTRISMSNNKLSGNLNFNEIPTSIISIDLSSNKELTGTIDGISKLVNATTIYLQNNKLSGVIPDEIGDCVKVNYCYLQDNDLTGNLPVGLARGKFSKWGGINLMNNKLSGTIPQEVLSCPSWTNWKTSILTQKPGFGFSNGN